MNTNQIPAVVDALAKPKQQLTLITFGEMGASRQEVVTKGPITTRNGPRLSYSVGRGRKLFAFDTHLERGCLLLKGHHPDQPIVEGDTVTHSATGFSTRSRMIGSGSRIIAPGGLEAQLAFFKAHLLLHTLDKVDRIDLVTVEAEKTASERAAVPVLLALRDALGPAVEASPPATPPVVRHTILKEGDLKRLREAKPHSQVPLVKLFNPAGAATWLLCGIEDDGDTLWAFCDIGSGIVEYGTVSLRELEELRLPLGMRIEKDKFFDGCDYTPAELLALARIPSGLRKPKPQAAIA